MPGLDDYTSVTSYRGKAVVDYAITRFSDINSVKQCAVVSCTELIDKWCWQHLIGPHSSIPDHNLVTIDVELATALNESEDKNLGSKCYACSRIVRKVGESFMSSKTAKKVLPALCQELEQQELNQKEIDSCYDKLVKLLLYESENSVADKKRKQRGTKKKEYWDLELSKLWKAMKNVEVKYHMTAKQNKSNVTEINAQRRAFRIVQKCFDKMLKKKKRSFCKGVLLQIEACNTRDPNSFWEYIKKLGPKQSKENGIP